MTSLAEISMLFNVSTIMQLRAGHHGMGIHARWRPQAAEIVGRSVCSHSLPTPRRARQAYNDCEVVSTDLDSFAALARESQVEECLETGS